MAGAKKTITWKPEDYRILLDFIDGRERKTAKEDITIAKHLKQHSENEETDKLTLSDIKAKLSEIVKNAKKDPKHTVQQLWRDGSSMLDLRHPILAGVYTEHELATRQNDERGSTKRKAGDQPIGEPSRKKFRSNKDDNNDNAVSRTDAIDSTSGHRITTLHVGVNRGQKRPADTADLEHASKRQKGQKTASPKDKPSTTRRDAVRTRAASRQETEEPVTVDAGSDQERLEAEEQRPQSRRPSVVSNSSSELSSVAADDDETPEPEGDARDAELNEPPAVLPSVQTVPPPSNMPFLSSLNYWPQTVDITERTDRIYADILLAVSNFWGDLKHDANDTFSPADKPWDGNLTELMQTVFGKTQSEMNATLSNILPHRPLRFNMVIRALIAAAVHKWVFEPCNEDSKIEQPSESSEGQIIAALTKHIQRQFGTGHLNQLKHLARKELMQNASEHNRSKAESMATKLNSALSQLFIPTKIEYKSVVRDSTNLDPLAQDDASYGYPADNQSPLPSLIDSQFAAENANFGNTSGFERDLTKVFVKALELRQYLEHKWDAKLEFGFPRMLADFNERIHFNEEYYEDWQDRRYDGRPREKPTDMNGKIFICLMPNLAARLRRHYTEDYGPRLLISRAPVFMLE